MKIDQKTRSRKYRYLHGRKLPVYALGPIHGWKPYFLLCWNRKPDQEYQELRIRKTNYNGQILTLYMDTRDMHVNGRLFDDIKIHNNQITEMIKCLSPE